MEQNNNYEYEEISIKELIQTLWDGKWLIVGITVVALVLAIGFTFYYQTPMYEAKTTLLASNTTDKVQNVDTQNIEQYINNLTIQTSNTLETYKKQLKSPEVLNGVIEDLELDKEKYSVSGLEKMITVNVIENTSLLEITVKSKSPELSKKIANEVSLEFIEFINSINEKKVGQSVQFLQSKINEQDTKLDSLITKYEIFQREHSNVQTVKNEISLLISNENKYKTKLENLESNYNENLLNNQIAIDKTRNSLKKINSVLKTVDEKLKVNKTVMNNDILREVLSSTNMDLKSLSSINLEEESYNQNYLSLKSRQTSTEIKLDQLKYDREMIKKEYKAEKELYTSSLEKTTKKLEDLQLKLTTLENEYTLLNNKIQNARETYKLLVNKYDEIEITESVKAGEMNLVLNSKAYAPESPVSPNKMLNLAIAIVLGLMIGVFAVFFKAMWESEE